MSYRPESVHSSAQFSDEQVKRVEEPRWSRWRRPVRQVRRRRNAGTRSSWTRFRPPVRRRRRRSPPYRFGESEDSLSTSKVRAEAFTSEPDDARSICLLPVACCLDRALISTGFPTRIRPIKRPPIHEREKHKLIPLRYKRTKIKQKNS